MRETIFVFGSNLAGRHGAGSAYEAMRKHGAQYGIGKGRTGKSYAIPTKNANLEPIPLGIIELHVTEFLSYAKAHPELDFQVVKIGCGLAGYTEGQISPMFRNAPENVKLPDGW